MSIGESEFESARRAQLIAAEERAVQLFDAIERAGIIRADRTERDAEDDIYALAAAEFGVEKHWHKRIVRAGLNTLTIALATPPLRTIEAGDLVYVDLGPVFEDWEADVGRTYVLGDDPVKHSLVADLAAVFETVQAHYHRTPRITGAELYAFAQESAKEAGWTFGGPSAGHLVSEFPHARIPGNVDLNRITPLNSKPMRDPDDEGRVRHWILEIHLVDAARGLGGFYERLL